MIGFTGFSITWEPINCGLYRLVWFFKGHTLKSEVIQGYGDDAEAELKELNHWRGVDIYDLHDWTIIE